MDHVSLSGTPSATTEATKRATTLSEDQRKGLESAVLGYLIEYYPKVGLQFGIASGAEDPAKFRGLLEEKWVCAARLTRRVLELEAELEGIPVAKRSRFNSVSATRPMIPFGPCCGKVCLPDRPVVMCMEALPSCPSVVAVGRSDGVVSIYEANEKRLIGDLRDHSHGLTDLSFNVDGSLLATAAKDGTVKLWDCTSSRRVWRCVRTLVADSEGCMIMCRFASESSIVTFSLGGGLQVWDTDSGHCLSSVAVGTASGTTPLALALDGGWIALGVNSRLIAFPTRELPDQRQTISLPSTISEGQMVSLDADILRIQIMQRANADSNDPPLAFSCSRDASVRCWDLSTLCMLASYGGHAGACRCITPLGNGYFYSIAEDADCLGHIWSMEIAESRGRISARVTFRAQLTEHGTLTGEASGRDSFSPSSLPRCAVLSRDTLIVAASGGVLLTWKCAAINGDRGGENK
ncbi:protein with putative role during mitosis [Perkinsus olseni]|uniref:Protein with putative role during mitosis n=1 Tax=Perkinsus olseni TaxID=32597 RepID=A0A7J6MKC4_PEROL|nr:protein with putative role during mitosis [Perkinsus olseni]KAF4675107.1 protein with putative role during mitosis [Perkinsus olseni]